jgi:hypothetical protein
MGHLLDIIEPEPESLPADSTVPGTDVPLARNEQPQ